MEFVNTQAIEEYINRTVVTVVNIRTSELRNEIELLKKQKTTKELMTLDEASEYLGKAKSTLKAKVRNNEIKYYRDGKRLYFKTIDLNNFVLNNRR
jgi:excisionase family DNA binding protein